ncbi:MAG: polymorphic toxin type 10 domain-containing protein, partial [Mangrovibacterium sp.]
VFIEERNNTWNTPFLFNGKELDEETGLYYYGARYYNPRIGLWYGVDPLAEKYPNFSPFAYTFNNPINFVDLWGLEGDEPPATRLEGWNRATSRLNDEFHTKIYDRVQDPSLLLNDLGSFAESTMTMISDAFGISTALGNKNQTVEALGQAIDTAISFLSMSVGEQGEVLANVAPVVAGALLTRKMPLGNVKLTNTITNPVPNKLARVVPANINSKTLGAPSAVDVFVTAVDDIAGMNASQIAKRLTIPNNSSGFKVFEFNVPQSGLSSPINRSNPGFVGFGKTAGGAREFTIPNQPIPNNSTVKIIK